MHATLKFLADLPLYEEEKPYTLYGFPDDVTPTSNCEYVMVDNVAVVDARESEADFKLDDCGFEFHHKPSLCDLHARDFETSIRKEFVWRYLKETIVLAEEILDAPKAFCFDWRVRFNTIDP